MHRDYLLQTSTKTLTKRIRYSNDRPWESTVLRRGVPQMARTLVKDLRNQSIGRRGASRSKVNTPAYGHASFMSHLPQRPPRPACFPSVIHKITKQPLREIIRKKQE